MEKHVSEIYTQAYDDISKNWNDFMKSHYPKLKDAHDKLDEVLKSGTKDEIAEAKALYERTAKNITVNNRRFQSMSDEVAAKLSHTNEIALSYVNDQMASIYTKNYNAFGEESIDGYSFALTNEQAVKNLATSDKAFLPAKKLDIPKDKKWNEKMINSQMLQGILQGESIPKMADRLMNVIGMNRASAIRNARTMTTAAENKGRQDSFEKAQSDGVIMKRRWVATNDDRTRAWHEELDGVEVDIDEPWENEYGEIMYPGDPSADPCNVYNCRCSIRAVVKGFDWNKAEEELTVKEAKTEEEIAVKKEPEIREDKNGLTKEEQAELMSYKSSDYYVINEKLRNEGFDSLSDTQKEKVKILDSALEKLPTYSGDTTRVLYFEDKEDLNDFITNAKTDGKLESDAYSSATKGDEIYNDEAQVQIHIEGSTSGKDLEGYDNGENEVLFERGAKFDILEQGWQDDKYVITAKEVSAEMEQIKEETTHKIPKSLKNYDTTYEEFREKRLSQIDDIEPFKQMDNLLNTLIDENEFRMKIPNDDASVLTSILEDGRFKNQFETATSGGQYNPNIRARASANLFGHSNDLADSEYEKYGYLGSKDIARDNQNIQLGFYGDGIITFKKDEMMDRTTFTVGDSLRDAADGRYIMGSKVTEPDSLVAVGRPSMIEDFVNRTKDGIDKYGIDDAASIGNKVRSYFELQYHGDITLDDIESITIDKNILDEVFANEKLAKIIEDKNIQCYYIYNGEQKLYNN